MKQEMRPGRFQMLYRFADGMKRYFVLAAFAAVLSIVFNFLMPQVIMITVDSVIGSEPFRLPAFLTEWIESSGGREMLRSHLIFCALACVLFSVLSVCPTFCAVWVLPRRQSVPYAKCGILCMTTYSTCPSAGM